MHTIFFEFFIGVIFLPFSGSFFTASPSIYLSYTNRNLICSGQTDILYNGTMTSQPNGYSAQRDYCVIIVNTLLVNNLTKTTTSRSSILQWNMYRNVAIEQCNFSTTMDIGYASCTPYYYQTVTSIQLCICSTNNCTATYSTCQASVNQALSSPPPMLPVLQPSLTNEVTCHDSYVDYSAANNITPPMYLGCGTVISLAPNDMSKCYIYAPNHTSICGFIYDASSGIYQSSAMITGAYETGIFQFILNGIQIALNITTINGYSLFQYETPTSIASVNYDLSTSSSIISCACTTNNCNVDITTCTSGMNIPSYLLTVNGTTSSTSIQSTSSSHSITSSGSTTIVTTGSTSNASRSISTAPTSVTTSTTNSKVGVGNNQLSYNSSTPGVKYNHHLCVAVLIMIIIKISSL